MTKTFSLAISLIMAVASFSLAAVPTQAATRLMSSSAEAFQFRCEAHGGVFKQEGARVGCQTPTVPVECGYFEGKQANCEWSGIEQQIAVIRVIGTLSSVDGSGSSESTNSTEHAPVDPNNPDPSNPYK